MINRARRNYGMCFLVLSLIVSPAAFAAAESSATDNPQAESEAKSYLPPWMQGKTGSSENASTTATAATPDQKTAQPSKTEVQVNNETAKKKVRGANEGQRSHFHGSPADIFKGFAGLFGR